MTKSEFHRNRGNYFLVLYPNTMTPNEITSMQLDVIGRVNPDLRDDIRTVRATEAEAILEKADQIVGMITSFNQRIATIQDHLKVNRWLLLPAEGVPEKLMPAIALVAGTFTWDPVAKVLNPLTLEV